MEASCLDRGPWVTTLPLGCGGGGESGRPVNRHASTSQCMCRHVAGCVFVHMLVTEDLCGLDCCLGLPLCVQLAHSVCACYARPKA